MSEATAEAPAAKPTVSSERSIDIRSIRDAEEAKALLRQLNKAHKALRAENARLKAEADKRVAALEKQVEELEADNAGLLEAATTLQETVQHYDRKDAFREAATELGLKPERYEHALRQFDIDWGDTDKDGNYRGEIDREAIKASLSSHREEWADWFAAPEPAEPQQKPGRPGQPAVLNEHESARPRLQAREPMPGGRNGGGTDFGIEKAQAIVAQLQGTASQRLQASKQYTPEQISQAYAVLEGEG